LINRRSRYEIVDFSEDDNDDEKFSYCKHCLDYGFQIRLKNRIYPENDPIPVDHDQFIQCHECGTIVPVYEIEKESSIKDVVETVETPFDSAKNEFLGIDSRKVRRKARKKEELFGDINDEDAKREISKGNTIISYFEHIPQ
jgi:hypothetical protein